MSLALCSDKFSKLAIDDSKVSTVWYCDVAGYSWNSKTVHFIHIKKKVVYRQNREKYVGKWCNAF